MTRFTIHFATINTNFQMKVGQKLQLFTIHFATINTNYTFEVEILLKTFTIHFATINTIYELDSHIEIRNLQYTLLLLIQTTEAFYFSDIIIYNTLCYY